MNSSTPLVTVGANEYDRRTAGRVLGIVLRWLMAGMDSHSTGITDDPYFVSLQLKSIMGLLNERLRVQVDSKLFGRIIVQEVEM